MGGTYSNLKLHIIFSAIERRRLIADGLRPRLYEYMGGIIRGMKGVLHEIGGMPDHVHLLVGWRTDETIAALVRELKSESSKWVHREMPEHRTFAWQGGYGVFTVSQSQMEKVRSYIRTQESHHAGIPFELEFERLLAAHGIDHAPGDLWKP